jgi:molecular chaperone GrpE
MNVKKKSVKAEKLADLESKWKRALADYANLEKRIVREKENFVKFSNAQLLENFLPILDDLELCQNHLKDQGLALTINKFKDLLKSEGVEEIKAVGEDFNPHLMDAVQTVEGPKNKVIGVSRKGYRWGDKVLRVAKVKVGGGPLTEKVEKELEKEKSRRDYM